MINSFSSLAKSAALISAIALFPIVSGSRNGPEKEHVSQSQSSPRQDTATSKVGPGQLIPGQSYHNKTWTLDDLLVDPLGSPEDLAGRIRVGLKSPLTQARQLGGTGDIGEIAVLEDDGTLVNLLTNETNTIEIINRFYETHGDEYDELAIFTASTFAGDIDPEAGFAFFQLTSGTTAGINRFQGIMRENEGLTRLLGWCNMNDLPEYPADFTTDFFGGGIASGVEIMGQEFEHAFGAFVQPVPSTGADILGRSNAHWSFFLHHPGTNNSSPMEGNRWRNMGGGTFVTTESFSGFSELDEYLMGLRPAPDVVPFYVIDFVTNPFSDSRFPAINVTVNNGTRIDLTIEDIVANHGPRMPDTSMSIKTFKVAFILVIPSGTTAAPQDLAKIDSFRLAWNNYFDTTTENLGIMNTQLGITNTPITNPFQVFDAETDNVDDFFEYNQGVTLDELGLNEPSGTRSLHFDGNWGGGDEIRSRIMDLSAYFEGELRLNYSVQRTGGGDAPEADEDLQVEYFNADGNWIPLSVHPASGINDTVFNAFSKTIPVDGYHAQFRYRIRRLQGSLGATDDWFVDDIFLSFMPTCPADADHDQDVDVDDLLVLLAQWGTCPLPCQVGIRETPDACSGDLDRDCEVDVDDLLILLGAWGLCVPENDDCDNARFIGNGAILFDTSGASTDGPTDCLTLQKDIWFCHQVECTGEVTISLCGSSYDAQFAVYDSCDPATMALLACAQGGCTEPSIITLNATQGDVLKIRVGGQSGDSGQGTLTISCEVPIPVNDECINAIPIFDGETPFNTLGASTDGQTHPACSTGGDGGVTVNDIWYTYVATCTGTLNLSTCDSADYDSDIVVYNPGWTCHPASGDVLGCNDDAAGCALFTSDLSVPVVVGQTYLIRLGGWSATTDRGTGSIFLTCN
ncbi:MAG: hypothetical protein O7G85_17535 [Planctomycetota bacterium]|nr:hypothetical protein [Planctomycetota bacterium]